MENKVAALQSEAFKALEGKLHRSLGEDISPLLIDGLKYSLHPTLIDAVLELSRSELLFVALLQALFSQNTVMSGRLLEAAEDWLLLPRISGYMGGKLRVEFRCTVEFVSGALEFARKLNSSGLITVSRKMLKYLSYLTECVKEETEAEAKSTQGQAGAAGDRQGSDSLVPQGAIPKRARRRGQRQRMYSGKQDEPTTSQERQRQDQVVQTATTPLPTTSTSSQSQIIPTTATSPMLSSAASISQSQAVSATAPLPTTSTSSQAQIIPTAATSPMLFSAASISSQSQAVQTESPTASTSSQPQVWLTRFLAYTDRYPWLWAVYVVLFAAALLILTSMGSYWFAKIWSGRAGSNEATEALWDAVRRNDAQAVRAAIENRADIEWRDGGGWTALHLAAYYDRVEVLCVLLRAGANTEAVNSYNNRPLHRAAANGHDRAVSLLAAAGADLHCKGEVGRTPLEKAALFGHTSTAALLLSIGG